MQIYDFDRDYKDVGVAKFTTKYFVVRNCLPNAKSDMLLSAWNPPTEWGKYATISVYFLLRLLLLFTHLNCIVFMLPFIWVGGHGGVPFLLRIHVCPLKFCTGILY